MTEEEKNEYNVRTGEYDNKARGLKFGYEYTTGNRTNSDEEMKTKSTNPKNK